MVTLTVKLPHSWIRNGHLPHSNTHTALVRMTEFSAIILLTGVDSCTRHAAWVCQLESTPTCQRLRKGTSSAWIHFSQERWWNWPRPPVHGTCLSSGWFPFPSGPQNLSGGHTTLGSCPFLTWPSPLPPEVPHWLCVVSARNSFHISIHCMMCVCTRSLQNYTALLIQKCKFHEEKYFSTK